MPRRARQKANPRALASEILRDVMRSGSRASSELRMRGAGLKDERDLRLATELVYGTLRHLALLDHRLAQLSGRPLEQIQASLLPPLRVGLYQILYLDRIPPSAAVNESVRVASQLAGPKGAGFVNAVLRKAVLQRDDLRQPVKSGSSAGELELAFSVPAWMVARWTKRLGEEDTRALLSAFSRPSPLSLWTNPLKGTPESLAADLREEGMEVSSSSMVPGALNIMRGNPSRSRAFEAGRAYLMDEASLAISCLLPASAGQTVLDLCAAPGGKSFPLACRVGERGAVIAVDRSVDRLGILLSNRDRLGIHGVLPVAADLEKGAPFTGRFASVLLDAPCTGTGTLGRRPEIRWRRRPEDLMSFLPRQARLLETAARLVESGGYLLYSVCSLEEEEAEHQVTAFLARNPEFVTANLSQQAPGPLREAVTRDGYFRTWPHRHGTDGFFAALLHRSACP